MEAKDQEKRGSPFETKMAQSVVWSPVGWRSGDGSPCTLKNQGYLISFWGNILQIALMMLIPD